FSEDDWSQYGFAAGCLVLGSLPFLILDYMIFRGKARELQRAKNRTDDPRLTLTDEGIRLKTTMEEAFAKWELYDRFAEGERVFILYLPTGVSYTLPKRLLTEGQVQELRMLLTSRLTHGTRM